MTDILAVIDDVLDQQPDLFENVLDMTFGGPVQYEALGDAFLADMDCDAVDRDWWEMHQELDPTEPGADLEPRLDPFRVAPGWSDSYLAGIGGRTDPMAIHRLTPNAEAHRLGRTLAEQIPWQP